MVEYIYLLQEREFVKTNENVYKIGQTKQPNLTRLLQYPNGSIVIIHTICKDCCKTERELIKLFTEKFKLRKDIGSEYFQGDRDEMRRDIFSCIENETAPEKQFVKEEIKKAPKQKIKKRPQKKEVYICKVCCACFSRNYNLKRHLYSKHSIKYETDDEDDDLPTQQNDEHLPKTEKDDINKCPKCEKSFSQKWRATRHIKTCNGIVNKFECSYCKCTFKHETSKYKHYKTCKEKNKLPEAEDTITNDTPIIYKIGDKTIDFNIEHFTENVFNIIVECKNKTVFIQEYVKQLLTNPKNRFIKKHSLREPHSQLHVGDNKWEHVLDKDVYPDIASTFANSMLEYMYTKENLLSITDFQKLREKLLYMADSGYINTEDKELKKLIENEFKLFAKNIKLIVHNITKN